MLRVLFCPAAQSDPVPARSLFLLPPGTAYWAISRSVTGFISAIVTEYTVFLFFSLYPSPTRKQTEELKARPVIFGYYIWLARNCNTSMGVVRGVVPHSDLFRI